MQYKQFSVMFGLEHYFYHRTDFCSFAFLDITFTRGKSKTSPTVCNNTAEAIAYSVTPRCIPNDAIAYT